MQGLPTQRPLGALHTLASAAWSLEHPVWLLSLTNAHRPALAQADHSQSVPRGLGHLLHILHRGLSLASEDLLLRPSLLGHCPSAPELFLLHSKSFITPETSLFTFPLWFRPDWRLANTLAERGSASPLCSNLAERSHTSLWN